MLLPVSPSVSNWNYKVHRITNEFLCLDVGAFGLVVGYGQRTFRRFFHVDVRDDASRRLCMNNKQPVNDEAGGCCFVLP